MRRKRRRQGPRTLSDKISEKIDGFVNLFSPRKAYQREAFRYARRSMFSSYRGASTSRLFEHWMGTEKSADSDIIPELDRLRERSRDAERNIAIASAVIESLEIGDVGTGIRPQSRLQEQFLDIDENRASELQNEMEHAWEKWIPYADASEHQNFYELQALADRQWVVNGEALFLVRRYRGRGPYDIYLQPIESDRLSTPGNFLRDKNRNIHGGIEIGERNQPVRYWIRKSHPGHTGAFYNPDADHYMAVEPYDEFGNPNILHIYKINRPGQSRGIPILAPILDLMKNYGEYREADIVAKRVRACFSVLIETPDPYSAAEGAYDETNNDGQRLEELEPGIIERMGPGENVKTLEPDKYADNTTKVLEGMIREATGALGLPYEVVQKDFSGTTYTSGRMALLEAWRYFQVRQKILDSHLNIPVYDMVQEQAYLSNDLSIDNFYANRFEYTRSIWIPQGRQWVNPLQESRAAQVAIDSDIDTIDNVVKSQGQNYEDVLKQRARERALQRDLNMPQETPQEEPDAVPE